MLKILRNIFVGEFLVKVLQFSFEILVVKFILVSSLPAWAIYSFILRFAPYCTFGSISYLNKFYPYYTANKDEELSRRCMDDTCSNVVIFSLLFFLIGILLLAVSFFEYASESLTWYSLGFLSVSLVVYYTYLQSILRNTFNFAIYIYGFVMLSLVQILVLLLFIPTLTIYSVVFSVFSAYLLCNFYYVRKLKQLGCSVFSLSFSLSAIKAGSAPFILSISIFLMQSSDRLALILTGDNDLLSGYVICFVFYQLGVVIVNTAGKVFSPFFLASQDHDESTRYITLFARYFSLVFFSVFVLYYLFAAQLSSLLGQGKDIYSKEIGIYLAIGYFSSYSQIFFNKMIKLSKEGVGVTVSLFFSFLNAVAVYYFAVNGEVFLMICVASLVVNFLYCLVTVSLSYAVDSRFKIGSNIELFSYPVAFLSLTFCLYLGGV